MMQEEVSRESIRFAFKTGKVSARLLYLALRAYVNHRRKKAAKKAAKQQTKDDTVHGKQTVKQLVGQGQGVSSMEIGDSGIRDFQRIAKKYGVDFAIVRDKTEDPPKYVVFFKAKDVDAITHVLKEYSAMMMKRKQRREKPSVLEKLKVYKEKVKNAPKRNKEKRKERGR